MSINEVDILNIIVISRVFHIGCKAGMFNEIIKGLGVLVATILSVHYCSRLGEIFGVQLIISENQRDISAFIFIVVISILLSFIIREGWMMILKIDTHSRFVNWGGLIFSMVRAYLLCGLIVLGLMISGSELIVGRVYASISRIFFQKTSIGVYQNFYNKVIVSFFPKEPLNQKIIDTTSVGQ